MSGNQKIAVVAKAVLEIITALHDYAPECCRCIIQSTSVCTAYGSLASELEKIAEVAE